LGLAEVSRFLEHLAQCEKGKQRGRGHFHNPTLCRNWQRPNKGTRTISKYGVLYVNPIGPSKRLQIIAGHALALSKARDLSIHLSVYAIGLRGRGHFDLSFSPRDICPRPLFTPSTQCR
jgi:hypothetical protein